MTRLPRWIPFALLAPALMGSALPARAYTDDNAEMKTWRAWMDKNMPGANKADANHIYGYAVASLMTEKAHELGMSQTNFHNASGLPDLQQLTTARDMAILGRHLAYDFPQYFQYFSTPSFSFSVPVTSVVRM